MPVELFVDPKRSPAQLIEDFKSFFSATIQDWKPDFIVPLESKGTMLAELCLDKDSLKKVIYPRAFDYLPCRLLNKSRFLLVDDNVRRGTTVWKEVNRLHHKDVDDSSIKIIALFDSIKSTPGRSSPRDLPELLEKICFTPGLKGPDSEPYQRAALFYLQNCIIQGHIPLTYDHLRPKARISEQQYFKLLGHPMISGRVIDYSKRGGYLASTILLDDVYPGIKWDFLPCFRLWFHLATGQLEIAPIGTPLGGQTIAKSPRERLHYEEILRLFKDNLNVPEGAAPSEEDQESRIKSEFFAKSLATRSLMLPRIRRLLDEVDVNITPTLPDLGRYYPNAFGKQLSNAVLKFWEGSADIPFPPYPSGLGGVHTPPRELLRRMTSDLGRAYEEQSEESRFSPKGQKGFSGMEALKKYEKLGFTRRDILSAIDFCFDVTYAAPFVRCDIDKRTCCHAMRSTEVASETDWLKSGFLFESSSTIIERTLIDRQN